MRHSPPLSFAAAVALLVAAIGLGGCASMSDGMSTAFADPAQFDLYDCKQLETARKTLATRTAELQGLMAKAETGAGGAVVAELAYRNEYIAVRGPSQIRRRSLAEKPLRHRRAARCRAGAAGDRAGAEALRARGRSVDRLIRPSGRCRRHPSASGPKFF